VLGIAHDLQAEAGHARHLARRGQQHHAADAEVAQDLRPDAVIALVGFEPEALVCLDRVESLVLQLVGSDLVGQSDAPAFLIKLE